MGARGERAGSDTRGPPTESTAGRPVPWSATGAGSDPAAGRLNPSRPETVQGMLREPDATRTTLGVDALLQPALLETWLQKVEDLSR